MNQEETDRLFMRRCLQLARNGIYGAKPNPMVGAVIVSADGRIIGEGYHAHCGQGHAEVNALASVRAEDEPLLHESTIYVSLEPCSHYGKTPPCADLIISKGLRRVVCGCVDPFAKVRGRGIQKLRDAGIEVTVGVMREECLRLNNRFITCNTLHRPYVMLKWAQTANFRLNRGDGRQFHISTLWTQALMHKLRSEFDCILVGYNTIITDHPQLNVRSWVGPNPTRLVLSGNHKLPEGFLGFGSIGEALRWMGDNGKQSLLVEGGAATLRGFIEADCWDAIRMETGTMSVSCGTPAPQLPKDIQLARREIVDGNTIETYNRKL